MRPKLSVQPRSSSLGSGERYDISRSIEGTLRQIARASGPVVLIAIRFNLPPARAARKRSPRLQIIYYISLSLGVEPRTIVRWRVSRSCCASFP